MEHCSDGPSAFRSQTREQRWCEQSWPTYIHNGMARPPASVTREPCKGSGASLSTKEPIALRKIPGSRCENCPETVFQESWKARGV